MKKAHRGRQMDSDFLYGSGAGIFQREAECGEVRPGQGAGGGRSGDVIHVEGGSRRGMVDPEGAVVAGRSHAGGGAAGFGVGSHLSDSGGGWNAQGAYAWGFRGHERGVFTGWEDAGGGFDAADARRERYLDGPCGWRKPSAACQDGGAGDAVAAAVFAGWKQGLFSLQLAFRVE